jgi:hypothetical protein
VNAQREINRLRALHALGITPLVARRVLPGAAPLRRLRLRRVAPVADNVTSAPAARGTAEAASAARRELAALREAGPARPPAQAVPAPKRTAPAPGESFSLAVVLAGQRLWVEELDDGVLAREQVELIGAIAAALLHPELPRERPRVSQFDWPLHGNQQLDLGPEEAAATLASYLNRQIEERGCVELFALGDGAAGRCAALRLACARRSLPSTRELLDQPARKAELWAALRP